LPKRKKKKQKSKQRAEANKLHKNVSFNKLCWEIANQMTFYERDVDVGLPFTCPECGLMGCIAYDGGLAYCNSCPYNHCCEIQQTPHIRRNCCEAIYS